MPTISENFERVLISQSQVRRRNRRGNRKRNTDKSTPLGSFLIKTEPMIVFRDKRCNGRIREDVQNSRWRTPRQQDAQSGYAHGRCTVEDQFAITSPEGPV